MPDAVGEVGVKYVASVPRREGCEEGWGDEERERERPSEGFLAGSGWKSHQFMCVLWVFPDWCRFAAVFTLPLLGLFALLLALALMFPVLVALINPGLAS